MPRPPWNEDTPLLLHSQAFCGEAWWGAAQQEGVGLGSQHPPLEGCGKKLSTKKGAGPAELGDRAALIQGCPELEVPMAGAPCPQRMAPVATCTFSDFLNHFANPSTLLHHGEAS